jgi:hypothetical protein
VSAATLARWAMAVPKRTRVDAPHWLLVFRQIQTSPEETETETEPETEMPCPF